MSLQVFLQARMLGAEEFLATPAGGRHDNTAEAVGRCAWLTLMCEVLPRALLLELKLSRMLLGSSSAEQFLLVLAEEDIPRANQFMTRAADAIRQLSDTRCASFGRVRKILVHGRWRENDWMMRCSRRLRRL